MFDKPKVNKPFGVKSPSWKEVKWEEAGPQEAWDTGEGDRLDQTSL
jgi:hypothetical protein